MVTYVTRDGSRLTPYMLYQINRLDAAFHKKFNLHILVSDGIRTNAEQTKIFLARYVTAGGINGRKVYDTRVWKGVTYYRISSAGTVAVPGTSNHEIQGSKAAADLRDSGSNAGVTVAGTTRSNWVRANASTYGLVASGFGFGEPWHYDVLNIFNAVPGGAPAQTPGSNTSSVSTAQAFLISLGYDTGAPGWGPKCAAATKDFQKSVGLKDDSEFGPDTTKMMNVIKSGKNMVSRKVSEIETFLRFKKFYSGAIDNTWGNKCSWGTFRYQKYVKLTADALWGAGTDAKAFPPKKPSAPSPSSWNDTKRQNFLTSLGYDTGAPGWGPKCALATKSFQGLVGIKQDSEFGPDTIKMAEIIEGGGNYTTRKVSDIQSYLKSKKFYDFAVDNAWGNKTSLGTFRYQKSVGLSADGQWGVATDAKAFPVTNKPDTKPDSKPEPTPEVLGRNATTRSISDIQKYLSVKVTGVWDQSTWMAVYAFQGAQGIDQDYVWGITCDGLAFPPTGVKKFGVDYSFARPNPEVLVSRGAKFVARYLFDLRQSDGSLNKGLSNSEFNDLKSKGLDVVFIYEKDGRELNGFASGVNAADEAERHRTRERLPLQPVYFCVDYEPTEDQLPAIGAALKGVASRLGIGRVGIYGNYNVVKYAFDNVLVTYGMQTYGWSGGKWDSRAKLRQWSNDQWTKSVDFQYSFSDDFGQNEIKVDETPEEQNPNAVVVSVESLKKINQAVNEMMGTMKAVQTFVENLLK